MDVDTRTCPACGTANPAAAKFCIECGTALALACPVCGAAIVAGQRFCAECGTALGAAAGVDRSSTPAVERRVCSILFCDLVGFTPISEARDPEAVRELLTRYFDTARTIVGRYGGTVEKFIGDAVMAVWGAERATEDDAERAVRAALELIAAVGALAGPTGVPDLAARAGVVTAEVAGAVGAAGEGLVAGDPVNTAARIQTAAEPHQVLCDDATARRVRASMEVEDAGARTVKGKAAEQHLWRAVRVIANVGGVQRIDGLEAPLIGRDVELRIVKDLFHATVDRRTSQLVTVLGEAGSGKSRLGWEFEKYVDGLATTVLWHRGRCLSYGDGVTFWALTEMVRQRLGIADEDPAEVALTILLDGVEQYVPDAAEREFVGVRLARLLGLTHPADDGRDLDRNDLFAGWRTWLTRLADTAPVVWVIEDLHFADSALLDFLEHLLDWSRTAPIHVLALARPDLDESAPGWTSGRRRQRVLLEPLGDAAMHRLLDALVPGMPEVASRRIAEQARGVPLFAVETIRALIDRDAVQPVDGRYRLTGELVDLDVPDSLRALFAARLDHLTSGLRDLVATAAVLGTTFPAEALAAVADRGSGEVRADLDALVARDLLGVSADPLSPQRGSYAFTHDLLRRVAVDTLSRREQRARHLRVAEHLRAAFADDGEEVADVIAQHLLDAADAVPDAPDVAGLREPAVEALRRAAARARRLGAFRRAAANLSFAAQHASGPYARAELLKESAEARLDASDWDVALDLARGASELFRGCGDLRSAALADVAAAGALGSAGRMAQGLRLLEGALTHLRDPEDENTLRALRQRAALATYSAPESMWLAFDEAFSVAERLEVPLAEVGKLFNNLSVAYILTRETARALAAGREALRLSLLAEDWTNAAITLSNLAAAERDVTPEDAVEHARAGLQYADRAGQRAAVGYAVENLSQALLTLGRWDEAVVALADTRERYEVEDLPIFHEATARAAGWQGRIIEFEQSLQIVVDAAEEDRESHCSLSFLSLLRFRINGDDRAVQSAADAVLAFRDDFGIRYSYVAESWVLGTRAATRLDRTEGRRFVTVLDAYRPTELGAMLRAERQLAEARLADDPEAEFPTAIAAQRTASSPQFLAEGLLDWAEHRVVCGGRADELIAEARAIGERLGAGPLLTRVESVARSARLRASTQRLG